MLTDLQYSGDDNMGILDRLKRIAAPKTIVSSDKVLSYFDERPTNLKKYGTIYDQGGIVSQAIDAYPLFILANGYTLDGPTQAKKKVKEWLYDIDINAIMWDGIVKALVYGDAYQENVYSRSGDLLYVQTRDPIKFRIACDTYDRIVAYHYVVDNTETKLNTSDVTHMQLFPKDVYGTSLIARAFDDILRDTKIAESTAVSIERHGYPRYHIKVGEHKEVIASEILKTVARQFNDLKPDNELTTDADIDIVPIDYQGVQKVNDYNEWSTARLLTALGVPAQVIGTGENTTTYATATVEMEAWFIKIQTMQTKVARIYNHLIDIKTGKRGQVTLKFNDISPSNEIAKMEWLTPALAANLITVEQAQEILGV